MKTRMRMIISSLFMALLAAAIPAYALDIGDGAPNFTAESTRGKVSLSDYLGKTHVVLAFYYADFTPVWTLEMQAFQEDLEKFKSLNTQVLGVSPDNLETHEEFKQKYNIEFPLISDMLGEMRKLYSGGRITYIIDKTGIIRFIQKGVPDNAKILKEIEKLIR